MTVNRNDTRWNGWGWDEQVDELSHNYRVWNWIAEELGLSALQTTPPVPLEDIDLAPSRLTTPDLGALSDVVGESHVKVSPRERAFHARGKSYHDLLYLRAGNLKSTTPDAVIYPANQLETLEIIQRCAERNIAVVPTGGGTSVVGGVNAETGERQNVVIALNTTRMNRVLTVDEENMTAVVEAGVYGPDLEVQLGEHGFTLGHFPQSFEFSTLGGWIAARGAGQQSIKYGKAETWFVSAKLATPKGFWTTECFPASAAGPDLNDIVLGSEGTIGVITEATVKIRKKPEAKDYRGYLFRDFASGVSAAREMAQARLPLAMVRLSDETETHFFRAFSEAQKPDSFMRRIKKTMETRYLKWKGMPARPCLMIVGAEGQGPAVASAVRAAEAIARSHKALPIGASAGKRWYEGRFHGPYARDPMLDHGLGADTLETSTRWSNILHLHGALGPAIESGIRDTMSDRARHGIVMGHISHSYTDGASLYYTFVFPRELESEVRQWQSIKKVATEAIIEHGGTISHHHGVGTDHASWIVEEKGPIGVGVLKAVKAELDAGGIMNPGKLIR